MSELLAAVSESLNTPEALVQRSAAARASANGTSIDDVLSAWSGGAPLVKASLSSAAPAVPDTPEVTETAAEPTMPTVESFAVPVAATQTMVAESEPEPIYDPSPIGLRVRTATRVGGWTGGVLGLIGFLIANARWSATATVAGEGPYTPVVQVNSSSVILGLALVSVVFGAVVAGFSRAAVGWVNPGMRLAGSARVTAWIGGFLGLVLGFVAGALLTSAFGTAVEGAEGMVQMPILATLLVMIIGGAVLGAATAAMTQAIGVPVAVSEDEDSIKEVRGRITSAFGVPLTGLALLLLIVLPFAAALLASEELASGGAAVVGILAAAGILTFASLGGSRPNIKLSLGEGIVAVIGIVTVIGVIVAVLVARGPAEEVAVGPGGAVSIVARADITFDQTAWTTEEGPITLSYTDEGDLRHTLLVEGHESDLELEVGQDGATDKGVINLGAGTYTLYCGIKGHREAGMVGTLTVTAAGEE